jgi:hypothetical protein
VTKAFADDARFLAAVNERLVGSRLEQVTFGKYGVVLVFRLKGGRSYRLEADCWIVANAQDRPTDEEGMLQLSGVVWPKVEDAFESLRRHDGAVYELTFQSAGSIWFVPDPGDRVSDNTLIVKAEEEDSDFTWGLLD